MSPVAMFEWLAPNLLLEHTEGISVIFFEVKLFPWHS